MLNTQMGAPTLVQPTAITTTLVSTEGLLGDCAVVLSNIEDILFGPNPGAVEAVPGAMEGLAQCSHRLQEKAREINSRLETIRARI